MGREEEGGGCCKGGCKSKTGCSLLLINKYIYIYIHMFTTCSSAGFSQLHWSGV